jgi:hypothetical protein
MILGLILICSLVFSYSTQAADPPLSLDDYWQKIGQTQTLIASLEQVSPENSHTQLLAEADQWERITQVKLPDGTLLPVDHGFLATQLRADPPDLARLDGLLTALRAARRTWPPSQHNSVDLKILESILARPEFQWQPEQPSPLAELWRRLWEFFWEFASRFLPEEAVITLDGRILSYVFIGLMVLLLAAVLTATLWKLLASFVTEAEIDPKTEPGDEILTADTALKQAQKLSTAGDYRTAVRYLYLSSLLLLDERGLLRYDRSQTNREYLRSVAHIPRLATSLRYVIEVFDRVWYGYQSLDEIDYAQYADQVTKLRQQK